MKSPLLLLALVSLLGSSAIQAAEDPLPKAPIDYSIPSDQDLQAFYDAMIKSVNKAQEQLDKLVILGMDTKKAPPLDWMQQLDNAVFMLKVKYALAWNLRGTSALRSPLIRDQLLQILNKDAIEENDVGQLQKLIDSERTQIILFDHASEPQPKP